MTSHSATSHSAEVLRAAQAAYNAFKAKGLKLNMQRGQPSDADFDLSDGMLNVLGESDLQMDGLEPA